MECARSLSTSASDLLTSTSVVRDVSTVSSSSFHHPHSPFPFSTSFQATFTDFCTLIPQYQNMIELLNGLIPILDLVGAGIACDTLLVAKLCRLAYFHLSSSSSESASESKLVRVWHRVISAHILPALSLTYANPGLCSEVWRLLKTFPYDVRYELYNDWKHMSYAKYPELVACKRTCQVETKRILRRISKENVKQFGRMLGKLCHGNPCVAYHVVLEQLQVYENLIGPVVDCFRYISEMGFDILCFSLIEALSNPGKSRLKPDGN